MFGIDDALLGAGASALASFLGGRETNAAQQEMSSAQMAFQERMSNTAYQRQVKDLEAAGLNPMLAYMKGSAGASTPVGSMAQLTNPASAAADSFSRVLASMGSSSESFARNPLYQAQIGLTDAQKDQVIAGTDKIREEIKNIPIEGDRLKEAVFMTARLTDLYQQQGYTQQEQQRMLVATVGKLLQETRLIHGSAEAMDSLDNIGKQFEAVKPIVDVFKSLMGAVRR